MSKSHVQELEAVLCGILTDLWMAYPTLEVEIGRDVVRLQRNVKQRGIHYLVVELPAVGKHFDRCLSDGAYTRPDGHLPQAGAVSGTVQFPNFCRELYRRIFDVSGRLLDEPDVEAILFLRQILYVGKKVALHCGNDAVREEVLKFASTDSELPMPEEVWEVDIVKPGDFSVYKGFFESSIYRERVKALESPNKETLWNVLRCLDAVSGLVTEALGDYNPEDFRFRHGPGATSNVATGVNKYCWTQWSDRLENVFPIADCGYHSYSSWADSCGVGLHSYKDWDDERQPLGDRATEPESKLVDVPKTYTRPRLIASEPSEHQWCQQNIWHYFCKRVRTSWLGLFVRFNDQTRNQELCRQGSSDGSLATLDLSEASDRVTCHIVGQTFRRNQILLQALQATRTRLVRQKQVSALPELLPMRKFATMGNTCTFPVESLVFLTVALASILACRKLRVTLENVKALAEEVAVFGDDIIVPNDCRIVVMEALEVLHFRVNVGKSFWNGKFRESCGVDAYDGVDVTPTYWRAPCEGTPESIASTVEVANSFQKKFMLNTSSMLAATITCEKLPQVRMDSGCFGLKAFAPAPARAFFTRRWNVALQRSELCVPRLLSKQTKTPIKDDTALLQFFTESPDPMEAWKSGVPQRASTKIRRGWVSECELSS